MEVFLSLDQMGAKATFQGCVLQERKIASGLPGQAEDYHNCPMCGTLCAQLFYYFIRPKQ